MDTRRSPDIDVIKDAERIVYQAKWRICEERAAEQLAATSSLKWTRLFPESPAIQVVAIDGVVVGCIRHNGGRWIATGTRQRGPGRRLRHLPRRSLGPGMRNRAVVIGSLAAVACSATVPVGQGAGLRARRSPPAQQVLRSTRRATGGANQTTIGSAWRRPSSSRSAAARGGHAVGYLSC